ncbi:MAG: host-nuclease inhibitor Gam family protein [Patescibacteria group bacterium]|nr:host-nuclease inhibitor Gam family protein [Patescibacteria group bacterium]
MKKTRLKTLPALASRDDAEAAMNALANTVNNQRLLQAQRDKLVLEINAAFEPGLAQCADKAKALTAQLEAWAVGHPEQFPKDRKSLKLTSGTLGFRTGNPKLALLNRKWTWDKVLDSIRTIKAWVREALEVDKESILHAYSGSNSEDVRELFAQELALHGMKVAQDEGFYIEPDLSVFESRQTP